MKLRRCDIHNIVCQLNFPPDCYWIIMGAALVMHNIKETTEDIDIGCSKYLFNSCLKIGYQSITSHSGLQKITLSKYVNLYLDWSYLSKSVIDGLSVVGIDSIIHDKELLSRPKDIADIELIRRFQEKIEDK